MIFLTNYFDKFLNNYLDRIYNPKNPTLSVPKLPVYMSLPFMGDHSYHCKKQLSLLINKYFPQVDFRCIFVNKNIVSSFFPFKNQIPLMMSSNIIYKYSRGQCQSSYIGETHIDISQAEFVNIKEYPLELKNLM